MRYEWIFGPATVTNEENLDNVVTMVSWQCVGFDDAAGTTYKTSGSVQAPPPDSGSFVPFDQIDQQTVQSWVYAVVDQTAVQNALLAESQVKPDILPFNF